MSTTVDRPTTYEGTRIPSRVPTILDVPPELRDSPDVLQVNFGPNHPSTHGVLRLIVDLHGEEVVGVSAVVGYGVIAWLLAWVRRRRTARGC